MSERQPLPRVRRPEDELDDFAGIEVTPDELEVRRVLFQRHDGDVVRFHDRVADCGDPLEEVLSEGLVGAIEWFYKIYQGVGSLGSLIKALEAEGHGDDGGGSLWGRIRSSLHHTVDQCIRACSEAFTSLLYSIWSCWEASATGFRCMHQNVEFTT